MKTFTLKLYDARQMQRLDDISIFVGEDASGSFGLKAHHTRFMTTLLVGLCRFRHHQDAWQYLALPGGVLYFSENELSISTRHFMIDKDFEHISSLLKQQIAEEQANLSATRQSLKNMEQSILNRLWNLRRYNE